MHANRLNWTLRGVLGTLAKAGGALAVAATGSLIAVGSFASNAGASMTRTYQAPHLKSDLQEGPGTPFLPAGGTLTAGQSLVSEDGGSGIFTVVMQDDGNFVEYDASDSAIWNTGTSTPGSFATLQNDGNFVIYAPGGATPLWDSQTTGSFGDTVILDAGGFFNIFSVGGLPLWDNFDTFTGYTPSTVPSNSPDGGFIFPDSFQVTSNNQYVAIMQGDGNFVEYKNNVAIWQTGTSDPGAFLSVQTDGNMVVYAPDGVTPLWYSQTSSASGATLVLQNDGNLVLYGANGGRALWDRGSGKL
jgi:hypothetical protein